MDIQSDDLKNLSYINRVKIIFNSIRQMLDIFESDIEKDIQIKSISKDNEQKNV